MEKPFNIQAAKEWLQTRSEERNRRHRQLFAHATRDCEKIVQTIIKKYHPQRVFQWGSLLNPEKFCEHSDIDIAIEGITSADAYFAILGEAMKATRFKVDIVQMEKIEPEFAQTIRELGKCVYEQE